MSRESQSGYDHARMLPIEPWKSGASLFEQLSQKPFRGEGYLMRVTDPDELKQILIKVLPPPKNPIIMDAFNLMQDWHTNKNRQKRKDGKTPYEVHPTRIAIRDAQNHNITPLQLVTDLLHDIVEDCGITEKDMIHYFHNLKGHSLDDTRLIFAGANALSNRRGNHLLKPRKYHNNILRAQNDLFQLCIIERKVGDRFDNLMDDLRFAIDYPGKEASSRIAYYLPKSLTALEFGKRIAPFSENTARLTEGITLAQTLLK